jgi:membrane fusion protein, multidrug efflux system
MKKGNFWLCAICLLAILAGCTRQTGGPSGGPPPVRVIALQAQIQPVTEKLSLSADLVPNERVEIKAEADGVVEKIYFDEGQRVSKGDLLVLLDESKFAASVSEANANLKLSQANYARATQLFEDKLISHQEYDQTASNYAVHLASLELKQRQLRDARIFAPFSGITAARQVSPGQVITRNTSLLWLVDLDTVKIEVKVPERYLRQVRIGQQLEFTVAAYPDELFRGEVYFISPQIDEATRTALVKARINNPAGSLRGGMFASLSLAIQLREAAIVIPEPALMSNGDNFSVFVIDEKGAAQLRPVEVGYRLAGKAEIVKGLKAGETVVVEGIQKLRPGAPVRLAPPEAAEPYTRT